MNLRRLLVLLLLVLVPDQSASGQGRTSFFSPFSAPITVSTGVENVPGTDGQLSLQTSLLIKPFRPQIAKDTARTTFRLSYTPEFELVRDGDGNVSYWNHAADFGYGHMASPRTRFTIGHSFTRTSDPLRSFQDSLFVLSRSNFRQNSTVVAARYDISRRTSFGARFDNTITNVSSAADHLQGTYLNGYGVGGTASLTRHLTLRQKVTGSYAILKFSPYQFPTEIHPDVFLSTLPTVRAGISRFAMSIGLASADAATTPAGMLGGSRMGNPGAAPGLPSAPVAPGIGAPVIGPLAAIDSWNASGPVSEGLSSSPRSIPPGNGFPSGSLVSSTASATTSMHAAFGRPSTTVTATEAPDTLNLLGGPFHVTTGTYTYRFNPGLRFEVSGGAMTDRDMSYLMGGLLEKTSDRLWMSVGFHHFLSHYRRIPVPLAKTVVRAGALLDGIEAEPPPDTRGRSAYTGATVTVDGKLTRNTEAGISASISRSTANFVEHRVTSLVGSARITHWLTERVGILASVDSVAEDRVQAGTTAFNRQRYLAGIQIRMSPPRASRTSEQ
jgi:hypothetical protein